MTFEQFLQNLANTGEDWSDEHDGVIRTVDFENTAEFALDFETAAMKIGSDADLAHRIAIAADKETFYAKDYNDPATLDQMLGLRTDLLKTCKPIPS